MNKIFLNPRIYNVIPLMVWFLLLVLPFISAPVNVSTADHHRFLVHILFSNLLLLIIFYVHTYLLYPLIKQKAWLWYIAGILSITILCCLYEYFFRLEPIRNFGMLPQSGNPALGNGHTNPFPGPPMGGPGRLMPVLGLIIAILCSFCYRVIIDNAAREQLLKERETSHLRTELSFLRSQINPHFLFNILNNLTSLARKKSDLLEPAIINLSQLMRYMLYESEDNKVPLKKEMEYLQSYIDLQLLRFGNEVMVKTDLSGNYENCEIDPMLFIPLVENAFKYGTDRADHNIILITLNVNADSSRLHFKVINYFDVTNKAETQSTGIGLKNTQRRLDLLYPNKHQFNTYHIGDMYLSELTIDLV